MIKKLVSSLLWIFFLILSLNQNQIKAQKDYEALFKSYISPAFLREYLVNYTSVPHLAGTIEDYNTAVYTKQKWEEFGIPQVEITSIPVFVNYPLRRTVKMVAPVFYNLTLEEQPVSRDPTSNNSRIVPTFNGYAPTGNVTAEVVYANFGTIQDFDILEHAGINVSGKIVLVRYGAIFRGTKVMIAQLKGAVGVLIYSDPQQDGFIRGPVFPDGPWRPESGVQRGSTQFLSLCPGDPRRTVCFEDPNNANYKDLIPKIPVQPISWGDALPILQNLKGEIADANFQGGLNITYYYGPGPAVVNIDLEMNFTVTPIWNVIGTISGSQLPNQAVILGNHRDAWVFGAVDPSSGSSCLMEVARGYGLLLKSGWQPKRTIILASWDGEEYSLLGSTDYGETNSQMLTNQAIAYFNLDTAVSGPNFEAGVTPSLIQFARDIASSVPYPNSNMSVNDKWKNAPYRLGSGSDYTVFLDYLGIPSISMEFSGFYGVYHSIYDSYTWMDLYGDPSYEFHRAMTQIYGLQGIRMADSTILPLNFVDYNNQLTVYANEIQQQLKNQNATNLVNLQPLFDALGYLGDSANAIYQEQQTTGLSSDQIQDINDRLMHAERHFLYPGGLPKRPYFKHVVQAPGIYLGYGADMFPGISEAVDEKDYATANQYVTIVSGVLRNVGDSLKKQSTPDNPSNTGFIVGITIAVIAMIALAVIIFILYRKKRKFQYQSLEEEQEH